MIKAVIFDMDGTIADTLKSIADCSNEILEKHNLEKRDIERYKYYLGGGFSEMFKRIFKDMNIENEELLIKLYGEMIELYNKRMLETTALYDGIRELLTELKERGIKLAVFTNKNHNSAVKILSNVFGKEYFDAIEGFRPGRSPKPDIEGIEDIMTELSLNSEEILYVGDSKYVTTETTKLLKKKKKKCNIITVHLGNGSSLAAVKEGKCVDTSMGMTPLAGVVMGTRSGDIDPAIHLYLHKTKGLSSQEINTLLNKKSGFKGICGVNDMRDMQRDRKSVVRDRV